MNYTLGAKTTEDMIFLFTLTHMDLLPTRRLSSTASSVRSAGGERRRYMYNAVLGWIL